MSELITMDREYTTRDGSPVRVLCVDHAHKNSPVIALVTIKDDGREELMRYTPQGRYYVSNVESTFDLIPKPKTVRHEIWVNFYENYASGHISKNFADIDALPSRIARKRIVVEAIEWEFDK